MINVSRRGFTLIEILIVIGIILLLVGIAVYAASRVGGTAKGNEAQVTLGNLRSMIGELEATAGLRGRQPPHMWVTGPGGTATLTPVGTQIDIWNEADPTDGTAAPEPDPLIAPAGSVASESPTRLDSAAVRNTQLVLIQLARVPRNQTAISALPTSSIVKLPDIAATSTPPFDESKQMGVPLDGWGNPIIFVPSAGLSGHATDTNLAMWIGGEPGATGTKKVVPNPTAGSPIEVGPIRAPDGRPFWASAGPDGSFVRADDNVYSFDK